jgi:hypothetical protein
MLKVTDASEKNYTVFRGQVVPKDGGIKFLKNVDNFYYLNTVLYLKDVMGLIYKSR